jgi:hypothetical protein
MFPGLSVAILAPFALLAAPQSSFNLAANNISLSCKRE